MKGQDVRDEILGQAAELKVRSLQARAESARIIAKSTRLVTDITYAHHAVAATQARRMRSLAEGAHGRSGLRPRTTSAARSDAPPEA